MRLGEPRAFGPAAQPPAAGVGLVGLLYSVSGALGLVYEVTFNKYLGYVFGATAYASSAVLVAFMGGLALGAGVAGRIERRLRRPLFAYGVTEIAIGLFCEAVPLSFDKLSAAYASFALGHPNALATISAARAAFALLVVLIPAAGMGATLPLLARFIEGRDPMSSRRLLARLYAINTVGGAAGSLLSAYWVLPALGLARTMHITAIVSMTIGGIAIVLAPTFAPVPQPTRGDEDRAPSIAPSPAEERIPFTDALVLAGASGLLVFASEVVFVHLLALVIGTSVYAFGLMLAIFLVCLAAGTPIATKLAGRLGKHALGLSLASTGLALAASLIIWDKLPPLFVSLGPFVRSWHGRELVRGLSAFFALFVPAAAMGTTFPLVLRAARASSVGADVGRLTTWNTLGSIAGSILGGFVLLPRVGSQRSMLVIAAGYVAFALFAARRARALPRARVVALAAAAFLTMLLVPRWDLSRLASGTNVYFDAGVVPRGAIEALWEDIHGGVTTVVRGDTGIHTLLTNGKFQGNDGPEVQDNAGFAHMPAALAKKRRRALLIGLGTGTSAGTLAAYDFEQIDLAELSPAIVETARTTFAGVNHHVLDDARVHLFLEDGRNRLLVQPTTYDVISIEISSIWFAGAANLYNREFYELASARLEEGGVLQQWVQLHHTNRRNLATVLNTIRAVFPHVVLAVVGHQGVVVAGAADLTVGHAALFDLEQVGYVKQTLGERRLVDFVRTILVDEKGIDAFVNDVADDYGVSPSALVSTDENLTLEYATPKANVPTADDIPDTIAHLTAYRRSDLLRDHVGP